MTKDEYIKSLQQWKDDNTQVDDDYGSGYSVALQDAISVAEKLDESKKVVIPRFVADLIEEYSKDFAPLGIVYQILNRSLEKDVQNHWQNNEVNQKLLLNAIANGYEVEKEPKYLVRVKGFKNHNEYYINYDCGDEIICLDDKYERNNFKTIFTKSWLKDHWSEYDAYNNAGLLEFEEVEDD